jgi:PAS domain S-box-containing protein
MDELDSDVVLRVVSEAPDGVVILDREGVIRYWNRGAERIFGRTSLEMIGSALDVIIPTRLRQRHWDGFRAAMARGSTKYGEDDLLAVPAIAADGRTVSIEFSIVLVANAGGGISHVGAIIRDVSARWAAEQDTRRRLEAFTTNPPG